MCSSLSVRAYPPCLRRTLDSRGSVLLHLVLGFQSMSFLPKMTSAPEEITSSSTDLERHWSARRLKDSTLIEIANHVPTKTSLVSGTFAVHASRGGPYCTCSRFALLLTPGLVQILALNIRGILSTFSENFLASLLHCTSWYAVRDCFASQLNFYFDFQPVSGSLHAHGSEGHERCNRDAVPTGTFDLHSCHHRVSREQC